MSYFFKLKNGTRNTALNFFGIEKFSPVFAQRLHMFQYTVSGMTAVALTPNYISISFCKYLDSEKEKYFCKP